MILLTVSKPYADDIIIAKVSNQKRVKVGYFRDGVFNCFDGKNDYVVVEWIGFTFDNWLHYRYKEM